MSEAIDAIGAYSQNNPAWVEESAKRGIIPSTINPHRKG